MSYRIYQTEGFVLSGADSGESNRFLHIYTKDLGLIGVHAQSLRKIESKLRHNLQDFSYVYLNVVRGKNMWRITDVEQLKAITSILNSRQKLVVLGQISSLMKRMLEEGGDETLYALFTEAVLFLEENTLSREELINFELLYVFRMLHHLGYGEKSDISDLVFLSSWNAQTLDEVGLRRKQIMSLVNTSLFETQL
ncbi:MAG: DNA repair protein RecO [Candidatus Pacebacteria bacterium]|nr:DNA repair protein RecO [Candidatus Paceibacterota bacterium]